MATETPKLTLYTAHHCPWAHRAHIALTALKVPYEEKLIDLSVPRTAEYLQVNPRGLVPSLEYNGEIITESAIVAGFLADTFPSTLVPATTDPKGPLVRARIAFFVDTFFSKAQGTIIKIQKAATDEEAESLAAEYVAAIAKEVEPLLADANPFFGGSSSITLAEVLTGSFVLRLRAFIQHGIVPASLSTSLAEKAPNFDKWSKAVAASEVVQAGVWTPEIEEKVISRAKSFKPKV
ncbi:glutathione S-transferase domain-containing protein [Xylariales sp. PMI_506]|nr:glutathione S-transferase domain-containing protein [Xylariales sp. PMI_506]